MCNCHSILECCVMFSGVKLSIRSFHLLQRAVHDLKIKISEDTKIPLTRAHVSLIHSVIPI